MIDMPPASGVSQRVLMLPDWRRGNPYQDLLAEGLSRQAVNVRFESYPRRRFALFACTRIAPRPEVLHLHWVAEYLDPVFWARSGRWARVRAMLLALDVWLVRRRGIPVVWTVHNRLSHESPEPSREVMARRWLARAVSHLIFHSEEARSEVEALLELDLSTRSSIVPHGNYMGMYAPDPERQHQLRQELTLTDGDRVILFFGAIRRYKGVARLLEALALNPDPQLRLIIAGKPLDAETSQMLQQAALRDDRVRLKLGFVPETDVHPLYALSHIVAVPFERTLTSGSAILALSMGKALLLPRAARVIGLPDFSGVLFFDDLAQLAAALSSLNASQLEAMGQHNLELARGLNWQYIGAMTARVYARLGKSQSR